MGRISPGMTSDVTWWVEFNKDTGKIFRIQPREIKDSVQTVCTSTDVICEAVVSGRMKLRSITVNWDAEVEQWCVEEKSDRIILDTVTTGLYKLEQGGHLRDKEILVRLYKNSGIVDVAINRRLIQEQFKLSELRNLTQRTSGAMDFFCTAASPDILEEILGVDVPKLFTQGRVRIHTGILGDAWDNISIYTRPLFNLYGLEVYSELLVTDETSDRNRVLQHAVQDGGSHIKITNKNNGLTVDASGLLGFEDVIHSVRSLDFVVCDGSPDHFVGGFSIPKDIIYTTEPVTLPVGFKLPSNPIILYKNRRLSVKYIGEEHA